jgi:LmbE family N-acetylglucosaminyl deacetylase
MRDLATYLKTTTSSESVNLPVPERALAIGAHPDDVEFGCGGTLAKWADAGCKVATLILTDGAKGSWDPRAVGDELRTIREVEARRSLERLCGSDVVNFARYVDGELPHTEDAVRLAATTIRQFRPDVVLGHDPWKRYRIHPDHRNAGWITTDAIAAARDPLYYPSGDLEAHRPQALLLFEADQIDHWEDVASSLSRKAAALLCHVSQLGTSMGIHDPTDPEERRIFLERLAETHVNVGQPAGLNAAEAFKLLSDL